MLELDKVFGGYGKITILNGVKFKVEKGTITTVIGPNGAGKSTVFKAVFGLLSIHSGTIRLDGQDVTRQSPAQMIAHGVTYVPQGRNVVPNLSVLHNLELGGITAKDQGKVKRRIDEVMTQFPILREKKNEPAIALSGGQQKQLEIARALLLDPKLILIDEPSIGLSPNLVQEVFQTLLRLRDQGVTILMVEQNAKAALAMSDMGIVLELGQTRMHDRAATQMMQGFWVMSGCAFFDVAAEEELADAGVGEERRGAVLHPGLAELEDEAVVGHGERGAMLGLKPDMASLAVGSNNFPTRVYENSPDLVDWLAAEMLLNKVKPEIEAFDLSHIFQATAMQKDGRLAAPVYVQFVMGVKNAMPVDRPVFDFYVETLKRLSPDSEWCGAGIGPNQIVLNEWCVSSGGHARTGLEDNLRLDRDTLAPSNAALVRRTVELCDKYERPVATPEQARAILGLAAAPVAQTA